MPDDASAPHGSSDHAPGVTSSRVPPSRSPLLRLTGDLHRWGTLFQEVLRCKGVPAAEQVLGGLVDWMGNDLLEGWIHLPIPLFEEVSDVAEELFRVCGAYLAWARQAPAPDLEGGRRPHEKKIQRVLERVQALVERFPESAKGRG